MSEFNLISRGPGDEIFFICNNEKYIGIPLASDLANKFVYSTIYHIQEAILSKELPFTLRAVTVDYLFEEKTYLLKWRSYFNGEATDEEKETLSDIFGYVLSDMPNISNKEILFEIDEEYKNEPHPNEMLVLKRWVYIKIEE